MKKLFLGIDIGGTDIKYGVFTDELQSIYDNQVPTSVNGSYTQLLDILSNILEEVKAKTNCSRDQIQAVGVGVPAFIDYKNDMILHMPNLGFKNVSLKQDLMKRWCKPVFIDNDANLAALGETCSGAGKESLYVLGVTIGTGIGSGIIMEGTIYHGSIGLAGEIGHLTIENSKKRKCTCGKIGCLETEVSSRAISLHAAEIAENRLQGTLYSQLKDFGYIDTRFVIEQAKLGDEDCCDILANAGAILGKALANVATILNPEKILIGGGVASAKDLILNPLKVAFNENATPLIGKHTLISLSKLGNRAGMIGAVNLAMMNMASNKS